MTRSPARSATGSATSWCTSGRKIGFTPMSVHESSSVVVQTMTRPGPDLSLRPPPRRHRRAGDDAVASVRSAARDSGTRARRRSRAARRLEDLEDRDGCNRGSRASRCVPHMRSTERAEPSPERDPLRWWCRSAASCDRRRRRARRRRARRSASATPPDPGGYGVSFNTTTDRLSKSLTTRGLPT